LGGDVDFQVHVDQMKAAIEQFQVEVPNAEATRQLLYDAIAAMIANIDRFFCHQVGKAHAQLLFEALKLDPEKNFETLPFLGNVGSVSAPVTMAIGIEQEAILSGQKAALLGIGSGINCLMLGIQW